MTTITAWDKTTAVLDLITVAGFRYYMNAHYVEVCHPQFALGYETQIESPYTDQQRADALMRAFLMERDDRAIRGDNPRRAAWSRGHARHRTALPLLPDRKLKGETDDDES
jgi:hypothetical protein